MLLKTLFRGCNVTCVRCLECERLSTREEPFFDLSLPVCAGQSLTWALQQLGAQERLCGADKYRCESCGRLTEAQRWLDFKAAPPVLPFHLKRFAFDESSGYGIRIGDPFPAPRFFRFNRVSPSLSSNQEIDFAYELFALVLHVGGSLSSGHYLTIVRAPVKLSLPNGLVRPFHIIFVVLICTDSS